MANPHKPFAHCPHCGAEVQQLGNLCWLCRHKHISADPNPYASPRAIGDNAVQFSLASLFLVMTLLAVGLGIFLLVPGLGVLFAFISTPALIRTMIATGRQRQFGAPLSPAEKISVFFLSWFLMSAIGIAAMVAFVAVCFAGVLVTESAGASLETVLGIGALSGLAAALPLTIWLMRITSPAKIEVASGRYGRTQP
jgi:hypothetical protein